MPQVGAALAGFFISAGASAATAAVLTTVTGQLLTSVALSALSQALLRPSTPRPAGIATEVTTQGGTNPQSFVLGRTATAGNEVCPPMSHGRANGTPNAYLTYVHDFGDIAFTGISRLIVNDDYVAFGAQPGETGYEPHPDYGEKLRGSGIVNNGWVRFHDGTQTTADAMLLGKYGSAPERPWTADMIGRGVPHAILTFRYNREVWNALPRVRYEVDGIRLYDPRKDGSVGGSGAHRWILPATWEVSHNPAVMIYNILRGITLPDGRVWGGECAAGDLPLASWFAAMNVCDEAVPLAGGGTEPRYRAGLEVRVSEEPAGVIEELLKACSGQIVEAGGVYRIRAGGVGLPVMAITDADVIVTEPQSFLPFVPLGETWNAVHASYPEPDALYAATDAPPRYTAAWEAEDQGRQLVADLTLPAVPYHRQVQRLMTAWVRDERRLRRHRLTLPPKAARLEPLDAIAWSSVANGYTAKVFDVAAVADGFLTLNQTLLIRERDSGDYVWDSGDEVAVALPDLGLVAPPAQSVVGLTVQAVAIEDATGTSRRPALRFGWATEGIDDVDGLRFEVRLQATGQMVSQPQTLDVAAGRLVTEAGLVGLTLYEVRATYIVSGRRAVDWTAWIPVTTLPVFLGDADFEAGIYSLFRNQGLYAIRDVTALPAQGVFVGEKVFNRTDGKLHHWTGSAWAETVAEADIPPGAITATEISDAAISTPKLAALAVTAEKIAGGTITGNKITANTITGGLLAASGIITNAAQINDALVTNAKIANAAITTAKIGAAQIDTLRVAGNAITVPVASYRGSQAQSGTGWSGSIQFTISVAAADAGQPIIVWAYAALTSNAEYRLVLNGIPNLGATGDLGSSFWGGAQTVTLMSYISAVAGTNVIRTEFRRGPDFGGTAEAKQMLLVAQLVKR